MLRKTALFFTYLFQPLFMATIGVLFIVFFDVFTAVILDYRIRIYIVLVTFVCTFIFPGLGALWLKKNGYISSLHVEKKEERKYPIAVTIICYLSALYFFKQIDEVFLIRNFIFGTILALVISFFINKYYKISQHLIGLGGVFGLLCILLFPNHPYYYFYYIWITISLISAWSRYYLKAHTPWQIISGFALGFLTVYGVISVLNFW